MKVPRAAPFRYIEPSCAEYRDGSVSSHGKTARAATGGLVLAQTAAVDLPGCAARPPENYAGLVRYAELQLPGAWEIARHQQPMEGKRVRARRVFTFCSCSPALCVSIVYGSSRPTARLAVAWLSSSRFECVAAQFFNR
jgi:hypothetical protein